MKCNNILCRDTCFDGSGNIVLCNQCDEGTKGIDIRVSGLCFLCCGA
jgi:hypothetical protein